MYLEEKEYYWLEMSHHTYKGLSQQERLRYECEDEECKILNRYIEQEVCSKFKCECGEE